MTSGEVDFGLVTLPVLNPDVEVEQLCWREDVAICHPIHPIGEVEHLQLEDLIRFPLLVLDEASTSRALLDQLWGDVNLIPRTMM